MLHALGVHNGTEDVDGGIVRRSERLETLVTLLAVVETRRHAMDAQVGVLDELWRCPLAGLDGIVGFDVAVDCR